jgi:hypothetical protein
MGRATTSEIKSREERSRDAPEEERARADDGDGSAVGGAGDAEFVSGRAMPCLLRRTCSNVPSRREGVGCALMWMAG